MKMSDVVIGERYTLTGTDGKNVCRAVEKGVREEGYRNAPRTNVRVVWEHNGLEVSIPARHLRPA